MMPILLPHNYWFVLNFICYLILRLELGVNSIGLRFFSCNAVHFFVLYICVSILWISCHRWFISDACLFRFFRNFRHHLHYSFYHLFYHSFYHSFQTDSVHLVG